MKMLAPELLPATVFWSQIETKIAKCDIGEAQHDPCDQPLFTDDGVSYFCPIQPKCKKNCQ